MYIPSGLLNHENFISHFRRRSSCSIAPLQVASVTGDHDVGHLIGVASIHWATGTTPLLLPTSSGVSRSLLH